MRDRKRWISISSLRLMIASGRTVISLWLRQRDRMWGKFSCIKNDWEMLEIELYEKLKCARFGILQMDSGMLLRWLFEKSIEPMTLSTVNSSGNDSRRFDFTVCAMVNPLLLERNRAMLQTAEPLQACHPADLGRDCGELVRLD